MDDPKNVPLDTTQPSAGSAPQISTPVSSGGKEIEAGTFNVSPGELSIQEIGGKEAELSSEIRAVGVKQQPTHIPIPQSVASMGVKQTGPTVPLSTGSTVVLPLSQAQISQGLTQNILTSWRWLSEWCLRRLKQIRLLRNT